MIRTRLPSRVIRNWSVTILDARWQDSWIVAVDESDRFAATKVGGSKRASTMAVGLPDGTGGTVRAYLKVYLATHGSTRIKDMFRGSPAWRTMRAIVRLRQLGVGAPAVLAFGVERRRCTFGRSFLLCEDVKAPSLQQLDEQRKACLSASERRAVKWRILRAVATEVAKLHETGFVHGDLHSGNILVSWQAPEVVHLIDHDGTRFMPRPARRYWQRKNLAGFTRSANADLTRTDLLRMFTAYADARQWPPARRRAELERLVEAFLIRQKRNAR